MCVRLRLIVCCQGLFETGYSFTDGRCASTETEVAFCFILYCKSFRCLQIFQCRIDFSRPFANFRAGHE